MTANYMDLSAPFEEKETFTLGKGGRDFTYVTTEAVITRLNIVLGVDGWSFDVVEQGSDAEHAWVLGRLVVYTEDREIARSQFGECKVQKGMEIGDARKGACSDALKKCASLFGVGLYLSHREEKTPAVARVNEAPPSRVWRTDGTEITPAQITCENCGDEMRDSVRKDGSIWTAAEKVAYSQKAHHGRVLCYNCSRNG